MEPTLAAPIASPKANVDGGGAAVAPAVVAPARAKLMPKIGDAFPVRWKDDSIRMSAFGSLLARGLFFPSLVEKSATVSVGAVLCWPYRRVQTGSLSCLLNRHSTGG
jgi:hypothetical protein